MRNINICLTKIIFCVLFCSFIACSDEKNESEVDDFDYVLLEEELDVVGIKIYDAGNILFLDENIQLMMSGTTQGEKGERLLSAENNDLHLSFSWNVENAINSEIDTFNIQQTISSGVENIQYQKGIVAIKSFEFIKGSDPDADVVRIKGSFNLQNKESGKSEIKKGIFYYNGKRSNLMGEL